MRKKQDKSENQTKDTKDNRDYDSSGINQRVARLEKKLSSNEQFANLLVDCLMTQTIANQTVREIMRQSLREDAVVHDELSAAIRTYDKAKFRRAFSNFLGILLWILSIAIAAFVGALIHWAFSGGVDAL